MIEDFQNPEFDRGRYTQALDAALEALATHLGNIEASASHTVKMLEDDPDIGIQQVRGRLRLASERLRQADVLLAAARQLVNQLQPFNPDDMTDLP